MPALAAALGLLALLAGCGMQPFEPPDQRDVPPVPGLITGKRGVFVILGPADEPEPKAPPAPGAPAGS